MAHIRKLSAFRQLSLTCENSSERRKYFKKQISEEVVIPPAIKIAWAEPEANDEGVVAKKCVKQVKKNPKLTRHGSLEKDSILYSKSELAERIREAIEERERERPNINIFLAHNTREEETNDEPEIVPKFIPKIIPPLLDITKNRFLRTKKSPQAKPSAVVVIPIIEKETEASKEEPKVIIRPSTAASRRDHFQKRTNSAFHSAIKEGLPRPPLVRSSSAPTRSDQSKPKFLATKRRIKSGKKKDFQKSPIENKENPNNYVSINGSDVVTMVSLVSPTASDNEEVELVEKPTKSKSSPVKVVSVKKEEHEEGRNVSLRKTVKSVSFQQSTIHAIRSFSASFPARRGSMATAIMLANKTGKTQEKRLTEHRGSDNDETEPKRRLVRSAQPQQQAQNRNDEENEAEQAPQTHKNANILVSITTKPPEEENEPKPLEKPNNQHQSDEKPSQDENDDTKLKFSSDKEKQCWEMYCKMIDKGLKVSYETILRGMLTPTEYRMRRKESTEESTVEAEEKKK